MEVGLPPGVVNIVTGRETGQALVEHPGVDKIAFTGSTEVGRGIRKATAQPHKKLTLELGGKSPFVVFDNADLDGAVEGAGGRNLVQSGPGLLRGIAPAGAGKRGRALHRQAAGADGNAARRRSARQGDRHRRHRFAVQLATHRQAGEAGRGGRRGVFQPKSGCRKGLLLSAHAADQCGSGVHRGAGRNLWPGAGGDDFSHARRSGGACQQHAYGLAASVWSENINVALDLAPQDQGGRGVGELHQPVRRGVWISAAIANPATGAKAAAKACWII